MDNKSLLLSGIIVLVGFLLGFFLYKTPNQLGGAPPGFQAITASTSRLAVGITASEILATSTCVSRILTTEESGIKFTLDDNTPVANGLGIFQDASTTVVYDSATYGCGSWHAISADGTATNVTVTEWRSFR